LFESELLETGLQGFHKLPENYGDTKIVVMVVDPYSLYVYWEIGQNKLRHLENMGLQIINITKNYNYFIKLQHPYPSSSLYINVPDSGCTYTVKIGQKFLDGSFVDFVSSNPITIPNINISLNNKICFVDYRNLFEPISINISNCDWVFKSITKRTVSSLEMFKNLS
jgi:hypothetical protein